MLSNEFTEGKTKAKWRIPSASNDIQDQDLHKVEIIHIRKSCSHIPKTPLL